MVERRGRPSFGSGALAIVPGSTPPAPDDLTDEQAETWDTIVRRMPESWLSPGCEHLLVLFCRHVSYGRWLAARVDEAFAAGDTKTRATLLRLHGQQTEAIVSLSRTLRLSPSAQWSGRRGAQFTSQATPSGRKPWEWRDD